MSDCECTRVDLALWQGKSFRRILRWETAPFVYKAITGITQAAPVVITAPAHGLPDGWRAAVVSAGGMRRINAKNSPPLESDLQAATLLTGSTVAFNLVNSSGYPAYTSGGYLVYLTPVDLTGYIARLTIKDRVGGTVLLALTSSDGITIDAAANTITILITAAQTAAMDWTEGVYELEMESPAPFVSAPIAGNVTVRSEVVV